MMYCTGGIRCDVYSPVLRDKGFTNLYTLHGGIANYLREIGPDQWKGSMFTFDNRLALAPGGSHSGYSASTVWSSKDTIPDLALHQYSRNSAFWLTAFSFQAAWDVHGFA